MSFPFSVRNPRFASEIYSTIEDLPIVSPHGHVPVAVLQRDQYIEADPARLFITDDHYVVRMLYSLGVAPESLGVVSNSGFPAGRNVKPEQIWDLFWRHRFAFEGTPSGYWISKSIREVFGLNPAPKSTEVQTLFDAISTQLRTQTASELLAKQDVRLIATTDDPTASLSLHGELQNDGVHPTVRPTLRVDSVIDISDPMWRKNVRDLSRITETEITTFDHFITALRIRRKDFIDAGATAIDIGANMVTSGRLTRAEVDALWVRACMYRADAADTARFLGHMFHELVAMSVDDRLVVQFHLGVFRDHNAAFVEKYGAATGADIPVRADFTHGLRPLLEEFGSSGDITMILFTLDESTYARELAPIAGHYPAVKLGPPWWFFDSPRGIRRYLDAVVETAGIENLAGFNHDTRNIATVRARHELWRESVAAWVADSVADGLISESYAIDAARRLTFELAIEAYRLGEPDKWKDSTNAADIF